VPDALPDLVTPIRSAHRGLEEAKERAHLHTEARPAVARMAAKSVARGVRRGHVPGCIAAASKILVNVRLWRIGNPPPRLLAQSLPYMLKDKQGGVERWLIPTESEKLIRGAAEDSSDDDSDDSDGGP
jgi:hypothetical protein